MVRKNVEKGKLGSAIVGLENKRWITIVSVSGTNWLDWILILILHHHITITIITITIITIRAREYIWLVEAEWPDARERERMANYRTPSQVLIRIIIKMMTITMVVMIKMMVLVMMAMIRP